MCVQKRRWVWKGVDLLLSQGKFQVANSWHACAAGSVTKAMQPPPFCPVRATPLIVSDRGNWFQLTPIQQPFDWQTKDTATWRLMLGLSSLEVVQSPPAFSLPLPWADHALAWSRFAWLQIKWQTTKGWFWRFWPRNQILHSPLVHLLPVISFNPSLNTHYQAPFEPVVINCLKTQRMSFHTGPVALNPEPNL